MVIYDGFKQKCLGMSRNGFPLYQNWSPIFLDMFSCVFVLDFNHHFINKDNPPETLVSLKESGSLPDSTIL